MTTHDAIGTLGYFARKIYFAAESRKESPPVDEGESIKIIGARGTPAGVNAAPKWPTVLPPLKKEYLEVLECLPAGTGKRNRGT